MSRTHALEQGRIAFDAEAWSDAYARLAAADRETPLDPPDLDRLSIAARLAGRGPESLEYLERLHQAWLAAGHADRAARAAVWLAVRFLFEGESARSNGWVARAQRLIEGAQGDTVEQGYVLFPQALRAIRDDDPARAHRLFNEVAGIGERFGDRELTLFGRLGEGRSLIRLGEVARGMALLDEVMVGVTAGEAPPVSVGDIYCSVIDACDETFDVRRAQEWTSALVRWGEVQPQASPYRGACLIRRAEVLLLHGEWPDALDELERACDCLAGPPVHQAIGAAWYRLAELHRLRGNDVEAEELYRRGSRWGRDPHPGLALLRLAQGKVDVAAAAIRRVVAEARNPRMRAADLSACVEIMLAANDAGAARTAADELGRVAEALGAPLLRAMAAHAKGAVLLAEHEPQAALAALREAAAGWRALEAPYQAACTQVLIGLAHRALGDEDTAAIELETVRHAFAALGATPDVRRVEAVSRPAEALVGESSLTAREIEVLRLIATGRTNRAIAERLGISQKTVARHVSNIFTKLGLSTRAAATAYAFQHDLLTRPT
ncbi:MAG TPA: response regulator transcription factor [Gemmatimonadales bacterium]|nr:response regulator transcription factor [Gemmatimonadales bacterium]